MTATYLDSIVAWHRGRAAEDTRNWRAREVAPRRRTSLESALRAHRPFGSAVIAEVKRRSPSKGLLAPSVDPAAKALDYVVGGATGISVLTDEPHFAGSRADLELVAQTVDLPILRKDFTVSENDVLDAAEMGASAVLVIMAAVSDDEVGRYLSVARSVDLDALVEVHDEEEAKRALALGATFIGVNQRDLHSFEVDAARAEAVARLLPADVVTVAESGFRDVDAVARAAAAGFDAVLVGETFIRAKDAREAVASFVGHPIGGRS